MYFIYLLPQNKRCLIDNLLKTYCSRNFSILGKKTKIWKTDGRLKKQYKHFTNLYLLNFCCFKIVPVEPWHKIKIIKKRSCTNVVRYWTLYKIKILFSNIWVYIIIVQSLTLYPDNWIVIENYQSSHVPVASGTWPRIVNSRG